ncbi:MAG: hypothetical protein PQJ58_10640 [Spirochaetales bacterium]|nr:hypothetical protein [Spirochaetales bacterium]
MLVEIENVRQIPGDDKRRWFVDENTDLIVWFDQTESEITGFQLCYDKKSVQRCLTWQQRDGGKTTLSADGRYSKKRVIRLFNSISAGLPDTIRRLVEEALS